MKAKQQSVSPEFNGKKIMLILGGIVVLLIIAYIAASFYVASQLMPLNKVHLSGTTPDVIAKNNKAISFSATDGIKLQGWIFHTDSKKLVILVSGLGDDRVNQSYMGPLLIRDLLAHGYNVLVYDTRDEDTSTAKYVAYGTTEGNDILGAVAWAKDNGFKPEDTGIIGYSTGAVSILMVADKLQNIGALILDSAAARYQPIVAGVLNREHSVPNFLMPGIFFVAKHFYHTDIASVNPIDKMSQIQNRPLLFLHGKMDTTIPYQNSEELLSAANKNSKLVLFPTGNHIETYKNDPDLYRSTVFSWLDTYVGK